MAETQASDIFIRRVNRQDIQVLWGLVESLGHSKDVDYFDRCFALQEQGKRQIFVATYDGRDVGYCILNWAPKYGFYKKLGIAEIQDLNVVKEARGQGIGTAMIRYCEDLARQKSHDSIGISVGVHESYGPAQRLYFKLGYAPDGAGVTYDRKAVEYGASRPVDDTLCLMLLKDLQN